MTAAITLSIYIARQFMAMVLSMLLALSCLISLFDFIELLRRSSSKPDATFGLVIEIAGLRLHGEVAHLDRRQYRRERPPRGARVVTPPHALARSGVQHRGIARVLADDVGAKDAAC